MQPLRDEVEHALHLWVGQHIVDERHSLKFWVLFVPELHNRHDFPRPQRPVGRLDAVPTDAARDFGSPRSSARIIEVVLGYPFTTRTWRRQAR